MKLFLADDPKEAPELILDGLWLTDTVIVPHMDSPKFAHIISDIYDRLKAAGFHTTPLRDNQALVIDAASRRLI